MESPEFIPLRVWIRVFDLVRIARCRWFESVLRFPRCVRRLQAILVSPLKVEHPSMTVSGPGRGYLRWRGELVCYWCSKTCRVEPMIGRIDDLHTLGDVYHLTNHIRRGMYNGSVTMELCGVPGSTLESLHF